MSDEQARRVGLNETLFREVNEQIRRLNDDLGTDEGTITIICECGDAGCTGTPAELARETDPRS